MSFRSVFFLIIGLAWVCGCAGAEPTVLGIVYKDEPVSFDLTFTNAGPSAVALGEIKASCDCLTVVSQPSTVAAGTTAKIACRYRSAKPGRIAVDVVVIGSPASSTPVGTFAVTGFVAEKSWLLSPAEVAGRPELALVDTRSLARFAEVHVPHALNIPAFAVKTRADLRTRPIVLVDDGFEPAALLGELLSLRAQGFAQVFVLDGGMASWLRQNRAVEGNNTAIKALAVTEITPADFFRARSEGIWQGVSVGAEPGSNLANLFPAGLTKAKGALDIGQAINSLPPVTTAGERILIIPSETRAVAGIDASLAKKSDRPVYYLKGGLVALAAYQAEQAALAANTGQTFQTKASRRTPIVSGACGSCGK